MASPISTASAFPVAAARPPHSTRPTATICPSRGEQYRAGGARDVARPDITVPAGYAFAKSRFTGRALLFHLLLALAVVPAQVAMLPLFLMLKSVGLLSRYAGVLISGLAGVYGSCATRSSTASVLARCANDSGSGRSNSSTRPPKWPAASG